MNPRKMIYGGILVIVTSIFITSLFGLWAFYNGFQSLRTNQTAGLGAISGMFDTAIFGGLFMIPGILIGTILIIIGNYKKGPQTKKIN
jgi:hypothetical protein